MAHDRAIGVVLPSRPPGNPVVAIAQRFGFALALVLVNWLVVLLERQDYSDSRDGEVSVIDALYYTTVTLTTTGYGDITPVTPQARLVNALFVTPMRLLFVFVLVGTTLLALTERSRQQFRLVRWRSRLNDHVVVLGYGTKGRNAVRALLLKGLPREGIVVVEADSRGVAEATAAGLVTVAGSATRQEALEDALVARAKAVIVALDRDDASVLATLTVRRLAPHVTVVAAVRESENAELLAQSGATSVIVSSETAGRLLGLATDSPDTVCVVEDLLSFGHGLDLVERDVRADEVGQAPRELPVPVLAVVRAARRLHYDDPAAVLQPGDRIVYVQASAEEPGRGTGR
ncbi:MAG: potassium channel family protein [Mycobacterium leprae]